MSKDVLCCYEDDETERVAKNMGENQMHRLPVLDRNNRLVGIVSLGDLSRDLKPSVADTAIAEISKPGGAHSQVAD